MATRYFSNTAVITALAGLINTSAGTITVGSTSGFPTTTPYTLVIDEGQATEELVSVTAVAGLTLTVSRGFDNTPASSHSAGAAVRHVVSALDFTSFYAHMAATSNVHGVTGTPVGTTDTQTLTNKTLGAGTVLPSTVVLTTGAQVVTGKDLSTGNTFPSSLATLTGVQALDHKDLTAATNTFPTTLVTRTGSETLTNKTITGANIVGSSLVTPTIHGDLTDTGTVNVLSTNLQHNGTEVVLTNDARLPAAIQSDSLLMSFSAQSVVTQAVVFPVAFATTPEVFVNIDTSSGVAARWVSRGVAATTTGFNIYVASPDGSTQTWSNVPVQWLAIATP